MSSPAITVITPAFNVETYIAEAIETVLAQTEADFEYLIVDDGSTDATAEIARTYAARDPRIRLLASAHSGSSAARNLALREARGEYIAFIDGDDRWAPNFLRRSMEVMAQAPKNVGSTFTAFNYIDQLGRPWGKTTYAAPGDYDANRMLSGHNPAGNGSVLLIKKTCFDEAGLFDEELRNCVDIDMWMRIAIKSTSPLFRSIAEPLVDWRQRPGSISANEADRVRGLAVIFDRYGHVLDSNSVAEAYTWPATLAYYSGENETAKKWAGIVRRSDRFFFLRHKHGFVLATFVFIGARNGRALRSIARDILAKARELRMRRISTSS